MNRINLEKQVRNSLISVKLCQTFQYSSGFFFLGISLREGRMIKNANELDLPIIS